MSFSYDFLIDMFGEFYAFFMRIASFLQFTPNEVTSSFVFNGEAVWSFFNPFTGVTVTSSLGNSTLLTTFLTYLRAVGLGDVALWQAILIQTATIWFILAVVRAITALIPS